MVLQHPARDQATRGKQAPRRFTNRQPMLGPPKWNHLAPPFDYFSRTASRRVCGLWFGAQAVCQTASESFWDFK